jgi:integrase
MTTRARSPANRTPRNGRWRSSNGYVWSCESTGRNGRRGEQLVFGRTATEPFYQSTVRSRVLAAWDAAGLEPIGLHEARNTFASLMIAAGVNVKALWTFMGHAAISITFDTYGHLMPGGETEARDRIDSYLERLGGTRGLRAVASQVRAHAGMVELTRFR